MPKPTRCTHNTMVESGIPGYVWKCADCGYVYGPPPREPLLWEEFFSAPTFCRTGR